MRHLNTLGGALACSLLALGNAHAQDQVSPWTLRLGVAHVAFSTRADVSVAGNPVPGGGAKASDNTTLGLELSYPVLPRAIARLLVGVPPTSTFTGTGALASAGELGRVTYAPAVLSMTWQMVDEGSVRPYVGGGLNYTMVFKSRDASIAQLDVKNAIAPVVQAGVEIDLAPGTTLSLDARKIFLKTQADGVLPAFGNAPAHADVRLDPLVVFASVGWRF